ARSGHSTRFIGYLVGATKYRSHACEPRKSARSTFDQETARAAAAIAPRRAPDCERLLANYRILTTVSGSGGRTLKARCPCHGKSIHVVPKRVHPQTQSQVADPSSADGLDQYACTRRGGQQCWWSGGPWHVGFFSRGG